VVGVECIFYFDWRFHKQSGHWLANDSDNPARVAEQPLPKRPIEGVVFIALLFGILFKSAVVVPVRSAQEALFRFRCA
jgi:hypothetical protein